MDALFVHGINVRGEDAERTRATIQEQMRRWLKVDARVSACVWGNDLGARLGLGGKTVPTYETARAPDSDVESSRLQLLWADLYDDPLYELAILANLTLLPGKFRPPGEAADSSRYAGRVKALGSNKMLVDLLVPYGWSPYLGHAVDRVANSKPLADLVGNAKELTGCTGPVARAVYACLYQDASNSGWPPLTGEVRTAFIEHVEISLGKPMGLISWFVNRYAQRKRGMLMDRIVPIIGDIIVYQGNGDVIRHRLAETIGGCERPVRVFAHSLGGVAMVDTLLLHPELRAKVSHLFTMGSQAGFFYEVGALIGLSTGKALPMDFPKWYSFYDHSDILSFLAEPAFPDRVHDIRVESGEPFPQSHSAYWNSTQVWKCVEAVLTRPQ